MNLQVAALLGQDGVTNGAIYALLAMCIVLVFSVTRVLLIPLGEFVSFGALTMASLQAGRPTGVVWLLAALCLLSVALDVAATIRSGRPNSWMLWGARLAYPLLLAAALQTLPLATLSMPLQIGLTLALLVPLGPLLYRLVYQPIAEAPTLVLLIVAIALHVSLVGVALLVFGPEGVKTTPFSEDAITIGPIRIQAQTLWVLLTSAFLIVALAAVFGRTLYGKALRAAAFNRIGARLMGISPVFAGKASFAIAALIGVMSGVLIAPITTIYYDSGFIIGLKGFVGSIFGGLVSFPLAAAGAVTLGLVESFSAFWASAYKDVIVFALVVPALLWRSMRTRHVEEDS